MAKYPIKMLKDELDHLYNEKIYNKFENKNIGRTINEK